MLLLENGKHFWLTMSLCFHNWCADCSVAVKRSMKAYKLSERLYIALLSFFSLLWFPADPSWCNVSVFSSFLDHLQCSAGWRSRICETCQVKVSCSQRASALKPRVPSRWAVADQNSPNRSVKPSTWMLMFYGRPLGPHVKHYLSSDFNLRMLTVPFILITCFQFWSVL